MKKFLLSSFVILTFIGYAIHDRIEGSGGGNIVLPKSFSTTSPPNLSQSPISIKTANMYKDGKYTGEIADAYYGNVQVKTIIKGGKLIDVQFLDYPHDRKTSERINSQAIPYLQNEAIQAQNAQVDIVSGATQTSQAFIQSLQSALSKAKS